MFRSLDALATDKLLMIGAKTGCSGVIQMPQAAKRNPMLLLACIAGVALLVRLLPLIRAERTWAVLDDSHEYIALQKGLLSGCGFARLTNGTCSEAELLRLPGYPIFLALMPSVRFTIVLQAFMGAATCLIVGLFTYFQWGMSAAVIAQTVLALDVPSIVGSASIMSDCLFQLLLTASVLLQLTIISRAASDKKAVWVSMFATLLLAYAVLIRAVGIVLLLLAPLPFFLLPGISWRKRAGLSLLAMSIPGLVVFAWTFRNHQRSGMWTFTTEGAYNLYYFNTAGVIWYRNGGSLPKLQSNLARAVGASGPSQFVSAAQHHEMLKRGLSALSSDPIATLAMTSRCFLWLTIVPDRANLNAILGTYARSSTFLLASENLSLRIKEMLRSPLLTAVVTIQVIFVIFTWIGMGITFARIRCQSRQQLLFISILSAIAFMMLLIGTGPGEIARFRVPSIPFLAILAGVGWASALSGSRAASSGGRRLPLHKSAA